jgi:hypothetical protein
VILKRYHPNMNNEEDIKQWMYTNEETDPGVGIAPRADLSDPPLAYGLIDCKISSVNTDKENFFWVRSSPTTSKNRFKPFTWATFPNMTHEGMPNVYEFEWQKIPIDIEKEMSRMTHLASQ